jgi:hypothetical protein
LVLYDCLSACKIEGPKFGRLRNKRYSRSTDQCECYCFHILHLSLLFLSPHIFRRLALIDNFYFLCPITKADVSLASLFSVGKLFAQCCAKRNMASHGSHGDSDSFDVQSASTDAAPDEPTSLIMSVQTELARLGYYQGQIDGISGSERRYAGSSPSITAGKRPDR